MTTEKRQRNGVPGAVQKPRCEAIYPAQAPDRARTRFITVDHVIFEVNNASVLPSVFMTKAIHAARRNNPAPPAPPLCVAATPAPADLADDRPSAPPPPPPVALRDAPHPLPEQVSAEVLELVLKYCYFHTSKTRAKSSAQSARDWDDAYVHIDPRRLCELASAAYYLEIPQLVELTCRAIANIISGKNPDQIRDTFQIENDLLQRFLPRDMQGSAPTGRRGAQRRQSTQAHPFQSPAKKQSSAPRPSSTYSLAAIDDCDNPDSDDNSRCAQMSNLSVAEVAEWINGPDTAKKNGKKRKKKKNKNKSSAESAEPQPVARSEGDLTSLPDSAIRDNQEIHCRTSEQLHSKSSNEASTDGHATLALVDANGVSSDDEVEIVAEHFVTRPAPIATGNREMPESEKQLLQHQGQQEQPARSAVPVRNEWRRREPQENVTFLKREKSGSKSPRRRMEVLHESSGESSISSRFEEPSQCPSESNSFHADPQSVPLPTSPKAPGIDDNADNRGEVDRITPGLVTPSAPTKASRRRHGVIATAGPDGLEGGPHKSDLNDAASSGDNVEDLPELGCAASGVQAHYVDLEGAKPECWKRNGAAEALDTPHECSRLEREVEVELSDLGEVRPLDSRLDGEEEGTASGPQILSSPGVPKECPPRAIESGEAKRRELHVTRSKHSGLDSAASRDGTIEGCPRDDRDLNKIESSYSGELGTPCVRISEGNGITRLEASAVVIPGGQRKLRTDLDEVEGRDVPSECAQRPGLRVAKSHLSPPNERPALGRVASGVEPLGPGKIRKNQSIVHTPTARLDAPNEAFHEEGSVLKERDVLREGDVNRVRRPSAAEKNAQQSVMNGVAPQLDDTNRPFIHCPERMNREVEDFEKRLSIGGATPSLERPLTCNEDVAPHSVNEQIREKSDMPAAEVVMEQVRTARCDEKFWHRKIEEAKLAERETQLQQLANSFVRQIDSLSAERKQIRDGLAEVRIELPQVRSGERTLNDAGNELQRKLQEARLLEREANLMQFAGAVLKRINTLNGKREEILDRLLLVQMQLSKLRGDENP